MTRNGSTYYVYDVENRLKSIVGGASYTYDGDGKRVVKSSGAVYWTGIGSEALTETDRSSSGTILAEYVFFGGSRIARIDTPLGQSPSVHYYFADFIKTTNVVTNAAGTIQQESMFYPFGGERVITGGDSNHYKFTGKERDTETGLDYFGARYFGSNIGRFMSPDDFFKDSHVGDPQSWNKYAYARNNPLRYVDPTGEEATVSTNCTTTNNQTTCNVNISASIAVYAAQGSNLTQQQLNAAASTIQSSIQNAWSGSFTQDGVTYNVTTQVSVQVAGSESDAMKSGAQNVIGLSNGNASATADSYVNARSPFAALTGRGPDTGVWNINNLGNGIAAHEFTHLLGVENKPGAVLSNTDILNQPWIPHSATASDLGWGVREAVNSVGLSLGMVRSCAPYCGMVPGSGRTSSTDTVRAGGEINVLGRRISWWK